MTLTQIEVLIGICIFIAVCLLCAIQINKDCNAQIKKCKEIADWAKQELEKEEEVEE